MDSVSVGLFDYIWMGIQAVFLGPAAFEVFGIPFSVTVLMTLGGFLVGIVVGATPGLAGPIAMAIALPILISIFGVTQDALLPVLGFLIGIMKGATIGGAVPAILFNTPGTPDALTTTYDGFPMAQQGKAGKALRIAHLSSASGDTFSDIVLIFTAPFLAILVERFLDLPEKTALILLSLSFVAALVGNNIWKGLIAATLGLLAAQVATGDEFYPRLTLQFQPLAGGIPVGVVVLGVLIVGEVFKSIEDMIREGASRPGGEASPTATTSPAAQRISAGDLRSLVPTMGLSAMIGTVIGALPGVGSTLAATLGYSAARLRKSAPGELALGQGNPRGVAATEAANSAVSGANLIPVLSLGIPGNAAAVFLILAMDSIGGFNPGPSAFKFTTTSVNTELVLAFGIFTTMLLANGFNWTIGGLFMRSVGVLARVPKHLLMPSVLLLTLTAVYVQETSMTMVAMTLAFGFLGYFMRRLDMSILPFVIAFILGFRLEDSARRAFEATGADPWFLFSSPVSIALITLSVLIVIAAFVFPILNSRRSPR